MKQMLKHEYITNHVILTIVSLLVTLQNPLLSLLIATSKINITIIYKNTEYLKHLELKIEGLTKVAPKRQ